MIATIVPAAALVACALALGAGSATWAGKDKDSECGQTAGSCQITLRANTKNGRPAKVTTFTFLDVPAGKCHGGQAFFEDADSSREAPVAVAKDRTFEATFGFGLGTPAPNRAHVTGKFSRNFGHLTGALHLTGTSSSFDSGHCDSGVDIYRLHRQPNRTPGR